MKISYLIFKLKKTSNKYTIAWRKYRIFNGRERPRSKPDDGLYFQKIFKNYTKSPKLNFT